MALPSGTGLMDRRNGMFLGDRDQADVACIATVFGADDAYFLMNTCKIR